MKVTAIVLLVFITLSTASGFMNKDRNYPYWQNIKRLFLPDILKHYIRKI